MSDRYPPLPAERGRGRPPTRGRDPTPRETPVEQRRGRGRPRNTSINPPMPPEPEPRTPTRSPIQSTMPQVPPPTAVTPLQNSLRFEQFRELMRSPTYAALSRLRQTPVAQLSANLSRLQQYRLAQEQEERLSAGMGSRGYTTASPSYQGMPLSAVTSRASTPSRSISDIEENELEEAFVRALERNDASKTEIREEKRARRERTKNYFKNEYAQGQMVRTPYVDEREAYRQHILSHSLFPNLYNERMVMTQLGSS